MKWFKHLIMAFVVIISFSLIFPQNAYAYLDSGTLSYILQMLIAIFVGGLFAFRQLWNKVKLFFNNFLVRGGNSKKEDE
jgi:uncharacterized membrane protein